MPTFENNTFEYMPKAAVKPVKAATSGLIGNIFTVKGLLVIVILIQILLFAVFGIPLIQNASQQQELQSIINNAAGLANINASDIESSQIIANIDELKKNPIDAEVYAEAQNGDYIFAYKTDKMVIYRASENKVIYNDLTPVAILNQRRAELIDNIVAQVKNLNLIPEDYSGTPELVAVTDVDKQKEEDPVFYAQVQLDDVIAYFNEQKVIVLYRAEGNSILNYGKLSTSIKDL